MYVSDNMKKKESRILQYPSDMEDEELRYDSDIENSPVPGPSHKPDIENSPIPGPSHKPDNEQISDSGSEMGDDPTYKPTEDEDVSTML